MPKSNVITKFILIVIFCVSVIMFSGCQKAPEGPKIQNLRGSELSNGVFIKKDIDLYQTLYMPASQNSEFVWECGEDNLIPHIEPGDELIIHTTQAIPESLHLISMKDFGYTAGMRISLDRDNNQFTIADSDDSWCPGSILRDYWIQNLGDLSNIRLIDIEGNEFSNKIVSSLGFLKGLEKDAVYNINLYKGTVYKTVSTKADSHVFVKDKEYSLKNYVEMKDIYFTVSLPKNMTPGYWVLDGYGMFYLEENVDLTGADAIEINEIVDVESSPEESESLLEAPDDTIETPESNPDEVIDADIEELPEGAQAIEESEQPIESETPAEGTN